MSGKTLSQVALPKSWNKHVRSSLLHVISLAQFAVPIHEVGPPTASTHASGRRANYRASGRVLGAGGDRMLWRYVIVSFAGVV